MGFMVLGGTYEGSSCTHQTTQASEHGAPGQRFGWGPPQVQPGWLHVVTALAVGVATSDLETIRSKINEQEEDVDKVSFATVRLYTPLLSEL